ncbi:hypothetical protein K491DRAFT_703375 [Lophiostoma macrostomum CBS 122681]|uniref:Rhodopsin domain-containing protein n=1 Tax=Lophiostoma macrostomum CBS 122681 TaxID=1314788 RepID=A0A6A6TDV7_9PLEO|nr:hypothetical protein K491DRAFT_703375 [Lophiostoma macrostomum CBS 122681]
MTSVVSSAPSGTTPSFKPALKPPPGVFSNPEHPATLKEPSTIAVCICCVLTTLSVANLSYLLLATLTTLFFSARCYCRYWIRRTFIFEDGMFAETERICFIVNAVLVAVTMHRHGGMHAWDITIVQFREASFWFNVIAVQYGIAVCLTKITVLMLYRRVFSTNRRSVFDMSVVSLIIIISLFYGITTFFKIFECNPRAKIFDASIPGHCYDIGKILKTSGAFNAISDYVILFLPIHAVYNLQMKKKKKLLVVLVFTFGLCAPAFATVGLVVRLQRSSNKDTSWGQPSIILWGLAELTSGNLCICFPEMGPLLRSGTRHQRHIIGWLYTLSIMGDLV